MLLLASVTPGDSTSLLTVMLLLASVTLGDLTSLLRVMLLLASVTPVTCRRFYL